MTKFLARTLCIFTFCLSASVLFAQGRPLRQAPSTLTKAVKAAHPKVPGRIFSFPHLEKLLIQRELLTRQALDKLPLAETLLLPDEKPALAVSGWPWKREPLGPYMELPFFRKLSPEAQRNYFLSANNRAIATLWKQRAALFKAIKARQNEFLTQKISNPTQEPFVQMAAQIGPEIKQVMIGEIHDYTWLQPGISSFLEALRAKYPKRQMVLVTEFLPRGKKNMRPARDWMRQANPEYETLFNEATRLGIRIKGLESNYIYFHTPPKMEIPGVTPEEEVNMWSTPEGMRVRNADWYQAIAEYRKEMPDALFIVYAGAAHLDYSYLSSLSRRFPREETFIGMVYPYVPDGKEIMTCDNIDEVLPALNTVKYLSWPSKDLRNLAGFDVRIKLPEPAKRETK